MIGMNTNIKYCENEPSKIKSVHIEGTQSCVFGLFKQAIEVTTDRKEIRILDINHVTSIWMDKSDLSKYIDLLQQIHDQMEG